MLHIWFFNCYCYRSKSCEWNICSLCRTMIPPDDVIDKATLQVNKKVTYIQTQDKTICPNCISTYVQLSRISSSQEKLYNIYTRSFKLYCYDWNKDYKNISFSSSLLELMDLKIDKEDCLFVELMNSITYRTVTVQKIYDDYDDIATSITGVGLPENITISSLDPNIIRCPKHGFGLLKLPRNNDFVVMVKSDFCEMAILEQCLNEMKSISKGVLSSRAGAAGGIMIPYKKCRSLSQVTLNDRILWFREKSAGMSVTYRNKEGDIKGRNAIYNDLYMKRYNSKQKFNSVLKSTAYQRILVKEMISRLRTFIILDKERLIPIERTLSSFKNNDKTRKLMEEKFISIGKTRLESKLLSWACSTGEMRNHQAVKSHYDGNKSHPVETMSIFGRLPVNMEQLTPEYVRKMKPGYLLFPLEGITIEMSCGYDLMHCSLKSTLHLADNTRNTINWTRVHGP